MTTRTVPCLYCGIRRPITARIESEFAAAANRPCKGCWNKPQPAKPMLPPTPHPPTNPCPEQSAHVVLALLRWVNQETR